MRGATDLRDAIIPREENCEHCADSKKILDLESIDIGIMGGFIVIEHKIDDVGRGTDEQELESSEVERFRECPEEI